MTGNLKKMAVVSLLSLWGSVSFATCDDIGGLEGAEPKLDQSGRLESIVAFGSHSVPVNKSSLVAPAIRSASLKAQRSMAEFIKTKLSAETINEERIKTQELTSIADGTTTGVVEENRSSVDRIKASVDEVLTGIVKLKDCYDPVNKVVRVKVGWKNKFSKAAAQMRNDMDAALEQQEQGATHSVATPVRKANGMNGFSNTSSLDSEF